MQAPIWHDPGHPLEPALPSARAWGAQLDKVRKKIGWLGDTIQGRRLREVPDEEIEKFLTRDTYPLPPPNDREGYWGDEHLVYWLSGLSDFLVLDDLMRSEQTRSLFRLLDFGCASGRVLRHFACNTNGRLLYGCDINLNNIQWIRQHLPASIIAALNVIMPPLPFADGSIDFLYAFSVFTHIDAFEESWLLELHRVLAPGGRALVTIHSERTWPLLGATGHFMLQHFQKSVHVVAGQNNLKVDRGLFCRPMPDRRVVIVNPAYPINNVNVFHSHAYIRERWGRIFGVDSIFDKAHGEHQDGVLLRRLD
jgi:SAM-dependent methyltransferase